MDDQGTGETVKTELSIFDPLAFQISHIKGDWIRCDPENQCYGTNTATPVVIKFNRVPGIYLDLRNSFVDMQLAIEGTDANKAELNKVAFINFIMHSLFKDISFSINNTKVEGENQLYSFKSYIYALINSS